MGEPGLDPNIALELVWTLLFWIACILGGGALLGFCAYIVFLCLEIFSPQPRSKVRLAKPPLPIGRAPVAEENLHLSAAETPVLAEAQRLDKEAVGVPAPPHDSQVPTSLVLPLWGASPRGPGAPQIPLVSQKRRPALGDDRPSRPDALTGTMRDAKTDFPDSSKSW